MRYIYLIILISFLIQLKSFAQDFENSIYSNESNSSQLINNNLFYENPASILKNKNSNWLKVIPSIKQIENTKSRKYDAKSINIYGTSFTTNKKFDSLSNFWGYANYRFEQRNNINGNIKYSPYSGEAFFLADTTSGNFFYKGPKVGFNYGRRLFNNFLVALTGDYQVFDGLKNKYSQAQSISRGISAGTGIIYSIDSINNFGINFNYFDNKEALNIHSYEIKQVEIHNYKGDKYFINERDETINKDIYHKQYVFGFQSYFKIFENLNSGFNAVYLDGKNSTYDEAHLSRIVEGISFYKHFKLKCLLDYYIKKNILLTIDFDYLSNDNYSSFKNKLIWEWNNSFYSAGIGTKFNLNNEIKINLETEFVQSQIDSSKHIDLKFISGKGNNLRIKSLVDYKLNEVISISLGGIKSLNDEIISVENLFSDALILKTYLKLNSKLDLNFEIDYLKYNSAALKFNSLNFICGIKIADF